MQVNKVNNTSFGYNKKLNAQVVHHLQTSVSEQKPYLKTLLEFNQFTNNMENTLRSSEKKGDFDTVNKLQRFFADAKLWFATTIEKVFPALNYTKREIASYAKEIRAMDEVPEGEHWLYGVTVALVSSLPEANEIVGSLEKMPEGVETTTENEDFTGECVNVNYDVLDDKGYVTQRRILNIPNEMVQKYGLKSAIELFLQMEDAGMVYYGDEPEPIETQENNEDSLTGAELVKEYAPTESAKKGFAALGGMKELKELLTERIVGILQNPEQAKIDEIEYGKKFPRGILMYGPPGCGKTTIVEHLSVEAGVPLFKLEAGSIGSKYIHETSTNIDNAFDYIEDRAKDKPALVFIDDADSLFGSRSQEGGTHHNEEIGTFLNRIQKAGEKNIMVIAATNKYDLLDEALRSRFEEQILVSLPDEEARESLIKMFLESRSKGKELANNEEATKKLAKLTESFPIRAIKMISDKASLRALKDNRRDINVSDFESVIAESQSMKVKEQKYVTNSNRKSVGF